MGSLLSSLVYINKTRIDRLETQQSSFQAQLNSIIDLNNLIYENIGNDDLETYWSGDLNLLHIDAGTF